MNKLFYAASTFLLIAGPAAAQADRAIIKVNGTAILQSEVLERLWKRYGPAMVEEMVDEALLRQAASAQKIKADPDEVERRFSRIRSQFNDPATFEDQLKQSGSSVEMLKRDLADQMAQEKSVIKRGGLSVKDDELAQAFKTHFAKLGTPQTVHLLHMVVKTEAEAKDLVQKIKGGGDFRALAKEKSLATSGKINGGDYGFVARGMLPPEIEAIAFALKPKEVKLVPGQKGVHILQALEFKAAVPAEFAKVKDDLREILMAEKVKAALPGYLQELRKKAEIQPQGQP